MHDAEALALLGDFVALLNESKTIYDGDHREYFRHPRWQPLQEQINSSLLGVRRLADDVEPALVEELQTRPGAYHWEWDGARDATFQLRGAIEQRERVEAILEPAGPKLAARDLHPWVWHAAAQLWDDGHRRAAVQTAASAVNSQLQAKIDRYDISDADLVTQAFTLNGVGPRLRFQQFAEGSEAYRSAHEGAMSFGRGCFLGIRNRASHDSTELDEQPALEQLAALSLLARWIDDAAVVDQ
jgi:Protein of unknown function (Hypoth_ymh)